MAHVHGLEMTFRSTKQRTNNTIRHMHASSHITPCCQIP